MLRKFCAEAVTQDKGQSYSMNKGYGLLELFLLVTRPVWPTRRGQDGGVKDT